MPTCYYLALCPGTRTQHSEIRDNALAPRTTNHSPFTLSKGPFPFPSPFPFPHPSSLSACPPQS
eukprot:scaffold36312_cov35-Tisochrysis_lutea.AAC.1